MGFFCVFFGGVIPDWRDSTPTSKSFCSMTRRSNSLAGFGMKCHHSQTSWKLYATIRLQSQVKSKKRKVASRRFY